MEQQSYELPAGPPQPTFQDLQHDLRIVRHADWRRELRKAILNRVVPRLSEIGRVAAPPVVAASPVTQAQVMHFADMILSAAVPALVKHVDTLRADGLTLDVVLLQLLAPAARHLGELWLADRLSFLAVTTGLGRLQSVMRALNADADEGMPGLIHGKKILLATVPGEQHIFGLSVVAAFFRRAGWAVTFEPRTDLEELLILVRAERFTAIGLSVANDKFLPALPSQVAALRRESLNANVTLLAGGPSFLIDPELQARIGADAVASDATEAVQMAEALSGQPAASRAAI